MQTEGLLVKFEGDISGLEKASARAIGAISQVAEAAQKNGLNLGFVAPFQDATKELATAASKTADSVQASFGQISQMANAAAQGMGAAFTQSTDKAADSVDGLRGKLELVKLAARHATDPAEAADYAKVIALVEARIKELSASTQTAVTQMQGQLSGLQTTLSQSGGGVKAFDDVKAAVAQLKNIDAPIQATVSNIDKTLSTQLPAAAQKGTAAIMAFDGALKSFANVSTTPLAPLSAQAEQLGTALNASALSIVRFSDATGKNSSSAVLFHKSLQDLYNDLDRYKKELDRAKDTGAFRGAAKGIADTTKEIARMEAEAQGLVKSFAAGFGNRIPGEVRKTFKTIADLEGQLGRFRDGLKNATSIESIARYNRAIEATQKRIQSLSGIRDPFGAVSKGIGGVAKSSDQATMALMNVSRVAQDAPYGFMGIANNLNPLLESFQRLQQTSGGTKAALASMVGALTGPAGIGLALGVVSSLLVTFGDKLFKSGKAIDENAGILLRFAQAAQESADRIERLEEKIAQLNRLAKIDLQIKFDDPNKVELFDLQGQSVQNREFISNLEDEINTLKAKSAAALSMFFKQGSEKAVYAYNDNLLDAVINDLDEKDKKLIEGFQTIDKTLAEQEKKLSTARNNQTVIYREIALSKVNAARDAAKDAEKAAKKIKPDFNFFDKWFQFNPDANNLNDKQFDSLLDAARSFAKEYGEIFVGLDFNMPDQTQALDAARKWWDNYRKGLVKMKPQPVQVDYSFVPVVEEASAGAPFDTQDFLSSMQKAHDKGQEIMKEPIVVDVKALEIQKVENDFRTKFKEWGKNLPKVDLSKSLDASQLSAFYQSNLDQLDKTASLINETLTPAFTNFFSTLQAGGDAFKALFDGLKQQVAQLITRLAAAAAVSAIIAAVTGGGSMAGFGKIFSSMTGLPKFANGGIIAGPTMGIMGEYAGARNNPEVVAPLNKLKSLLGGAQGSGNVTVTGRISGGDILLSNARTNRKQRRGG